MKLAKCIYLSKGCVLYDDLARPLMTIIEDTVGRHDTLAGNCSREINVVRYGATAPLSCRDNFIKALGELGMGPRDIPANVNFFMNVPVSADGQVAITDGISKPGDYVDLRCERSSPTARKSITLAPAENRHRSNSRYGSRMRQPSGAGPPAR